MDGRLVMSCEQPSEALHGLLVYVNQRMVAERPDLLSIHAGAVATAAGAVLLPASSGSGKTTLCARLLQLGAAYLSDDSVALDHVGRVLGYPKPLAFKPGTWKAFDDAGLGDLDLDPGRQFVWQVPPGRLGARSLSSAEPVAVAVPRFERGAELRIEAVSPHCAAALLLEQVQNLQAFGVREALGVIGRLVARIPCYSVVYGDARAAAPVVLDLIGTVSHGVAPNEVIPAGTLSEPVEGPRSAHDVSALCFEDGGVLVRAGSGEFAVIDEGGTAIWQLMDGHRSPRSISSALATRFNAPPPQIEADVNRWIGDLIARGFVDGPPDRP